MARFFYDIRDVYLIGIQLLLIAMDLVLLIVYMSQLTGHFNFTQKFILYSGILVSLLYSIICMRYIFMMFSRIDIFPKRFSMILHSIAYITILSALTMFALTISYSGLMPTCCEKVKYIMPYILVLTFIISTQLSYKIEWLSTAFAVIITALLLVSVTLLRLKSRYDFIKTFNTEWPEEIKELSYGGLVALYIISIVYDIFHILSLYIDDFFHVYVTVVDVAFSIGLFSVIVFSNHRLDLIVLAGENLPQV